MLAAMKHTCMPRCEDDKGAKKNIQVARRDDHRTQIRADAATAMQCHTYEAQDAEIAKTCFTCHQRLRKKDKLGKHWKRQQQTKAMVTLHPSSESSTECTSHDKPIAAQTNAPTACTNPLSSPMPQTTLEETLVKSHSEKPKNEHGHLHEQ